MSQPIKIMRLFSRLNIGGPALHVVNLSFGLNSYNYHTLLVVGQIGKDEGDMSSYASEKNIKPIQVPEFQAAISPWKDLVAFIKIFKLMLKFKPDIVHTHTFKAGLLGRLAAVLSRVPCRVHTYHGHLLEGYGSKFRTKIIVSVEKILNYFTDEIVVVSDRVGQDLIRHHIAPSRKVNTIELGFDVDQFIEDCKQSSTLRKSLGISEDDLLVGIAGRLVPVKNVEGFLMAMSPLFSKFKGLNAVIIGDGPERQKLEDLAAKIDGKYHFSGWILPLHPQLKDLDLLVCSSENEGTSVSVIESVLCNVPVVSTNVGGMSDLLKNGQFGDLVPLSTPELSKKIEQRLRNLIESNTNDSLEFRNRTELASETFKKRFHLKRLLEDTVAVYAKLF